MTTHFTKKQIQQARQADLFSYLQANEPGVLKKDGRNYRHREHDSLVYVTAKNFWYWNSRGKSITALDYLMEIRGYSFSEAVSRLIGDAPARASPQVAYSQNDSKPKQQRPSKLYLPWPKKCATGYFKYLRKRGISAKVIQRCRELGLLYEGKYKPKKDEKIVPVWVISRIILSATPKAASVWKRIKTASLKSSRLILRARNARRSTPPLTI